MAVTKLTCPSCAAPLKLPKPVDAGKQIRCPKCKSVFRVPAEENKVVAREEVPEPEPKPAARPKSAPVPSHAVTRSRPAPSRARRPDDEEADERDDRDDEPPVRKAPRKGKKKRREDVLFAGVVAGLIGAALAVLIYLIAKNTAGTEKKFKPIPQKTHDDRCQPKWPKAARASCPSDAVLECPSAGRATCV
jgi:outer membrane biosynthesis protein TonB